MYSVPLRSVQIFLQAMLQVWQPMHLSRWNTMEICERTFIVALLVGSCLPFQLRQLADQDVGIAIHSGRPPVIEMVGKLAVSTHHQIGLEPHSGQAVVATGPTVSSQRGFGNRIRALRSVILKADAPRNAGAHRCSPYDHPMI